METIPCNMVSNLSFVNHYSIDFITNIKNVEHSTNSFH